MECRRPSRSSVAAWFALQLFPVLLAVMAMRSDRCASPLDPGDSPQARRVDAFDEGRPASAPVTDATEPAPRSRPPQAFQTGEVRLEIAVHSLAFAQQALGDGDNEGAHAAAERCLAVDPTEGECAHVRASASMRGGAFERARSEVDVCLGFDPDDVACLEGDVTLRIRDDDLSGAAHIVDRLAQLAPGSVSYELAAGMLDDARGEDERAHAHLAAACDLGQPWACGEVRRNAPESPERDARHAPWRGVVALLAIVLRR